MRGKAERREQRIRLKGHGLAEDLVSYYNVLIQSPVWGSWRGTYLEARMNTMRDQAAKEDQNDM